MQNLGAQLRTWRKIRHLSQHDLAAKSGVSRSYIDKLEREEKVNISVLMLMKLADALGTTLDELAKGE